MALMTPLPLSVCLITRDEAHNLPGLMESVRGLAQEVVVVDTGSHDGTPDLARALGARVIHSPWKDDFSEARNVALEAAQSPWILSMDADQQLDAAAVPLLQAALDRQDCAAQLVTIRLLGPANPHGSQNVVRCLPSLRLFRRDTRIRYRGRVHEDVADSLIDMGSSLWPDSGITLTDHGYMDEGARRQKLGRNLALLRQAVAEQPTALHLAYKLATSLPVAGVEERRHVLEAAMNQALDTPAAVLRELTCLPRLLGAAVHLWVEQGRLEEAAQVAWTLQKQVENALDFTAGRALARAGRFAQARQCLSAYIDESNTRVREGPLPAAQGSLVQQDEEATVQEACRWLAWMAYREGQCGEAQDWIALGRQAAALPHAPLESLAVEVLIHMGDFSGAVQTLERWGEALGVDEGQQTQALPEMMASSARLAMGSGDLASAREFARLATRAVDDAAAVLLTQMALALNAGKPTSPVREQANTIKGLRFDTLALKLSLSTDGARTWPHPLPQATRQLVDTLVAD
jgi:hypothetical protein